jgi:hypothetical protein
MKITVGPAARPPVLLQSRIQGHQRLALSGSAWQRVSDSPPGRAMDGTSPPEQWTVPHHQSNGRYLTTRAMDGTSPPEQWTVPHHQSNGRYLFPPRMCFSSSSCLASLTRKSLMGFAKLYTYMLRLTAQCLPADISRRGNMVAISTVMSNQSPSGPLNEDSSILFQIKYFALLRCVLIHSCSR